jgi:hypothetical protein
VKLNRQTVKRRAFDDWYEDEAPWYYTWSAYDLSDEAPRFRSVSQAAHQAMRITASTPIGFHRPKA